MTEINKTSQNPLTSKTLWVAILTSLVGLLTYLGTDTFVLQNPKIAGAFVAILGILQFILRLLTTVPIGTKKSL